MRTSVTGTGQDCCQTPQGPSTAAAAAKADTRAVALVGSPNCGKTTLFNWLTGSRSKTVNYPGSTVDHSLGQSHARFHENSRFKTPFTIMDTPGTYSLDPKSPDERVTLEAIFAHPRLGVARLVVSVVDATHLSRHLFITRQLLSAGFRVILAVTMADLAREHEEEVDVARLSAELGIPVVLIDGRLGGGVPELIEKIGEELARPLPPVTPVRPGAWSDEKIEETLREIARLASRVVKPLDRGGSKTKTGDLRQTARARTRRLDRVLLHPVWGLAVFIVLMATLFSSIFWLAQPLMDAVDQTMTALAEFTLRLAPHSLGVQFLSEGVLASLSAVLVFVPQIFILFFGIILLEDSGYLARSATLVDKPLSLLGLGGRSFVPLLSGYACAVPAMMAARTINSRRERLLTLFMIPLMSCSARLPVFALLLSFLFQGEAAWKAGLALTGIYIFSLLLGAVAVLIAGRFLKNSERSFFMLELPVYRRPKLWVVLRQAFSRTKAYILSAGPAIFVFALIVWAATTFPRIDLENKAERMQASYAARVGQVIEPVFTPMGGDWRTGVGLISAFAAREVFVSGLAVLFQVTDAEEDSMQTTLLNKMHEAKAPDGRPLFTLASVLGLVIFFMIALQCLSTFTVAVRESGGLKFALIQLLTFNLVGYAAAVSVVQGLRALGLP